MKTKIILIALISALLMACRGDGGTDTRSFIPGTYVNYAEGEYSIAYDTLIIQPMSEQNSSYRIYRKTAYQRKENGKLMKLRRESEEWITLYNEETKSMQEVKRGKIITIYPDANRILVVNREYTKLVNKN
ncbi:MAG: hypothetical protein V4663_02300 [Bacteroidota bacterium]